MLKLQSLLVWLLYVPDRHIRWNVWLMIMSLLPVPIALLLLWDHTSASPQHTWKSAPSNYWFPMWNLSKSCNEANKFYQHKLKSLSLKRLIKVFGVFGDILLSEREPGNQETLANLHVINLFIRHYIWAVPAFNERSFCFFSCLSRGKCTGSLSSMWRLVDRQNVKNKLSLQTLSYQGDCMASGCGVWLPPCLLGRREVIAFSCETAFRFQQWGLNIRPCSYETSLARALSGLRWRFSETDHLSASLLLKRLWFCTTKLIESNLRLTHTDIMILSKYAFDRKWPRTMIIIILVIDCVEYSTM